MNPHALSYQLQTMPVAAMLGGSTLLGLFITSTGKQWFLCRENITLMLFMLWMTLVLPFSFFFDSAFPLWSRVMKIDLMILVAMVLLHSKRHINLLVWTLVISIGFYGVKGGMFTIATGGSYRVWGPENTYIEGNNEVALAFVIVIPLMRYLQLQMTGKKARMVMTFCMLCMAMAALGSHSRGALLAIFAMGAVLWWRSKNRFGGAVAFAVLAIAMLSFMPAEWWSRMDTIKDYKEDGSAMGRINAWWMAFNLAKANFMGGGMQIYEAQTFALYAPDPTDIHAAHSIYFMVLGELGFVGLFIFLTFFMFTFGTASKVFKLGKLRPQTQWASDLGGMIQVSLIGYAVGGAFLSLSYWDLPYNLMVLAVACKRWIDNKRWETEPEEPTWVLPGFLQRAPKRPPPSLMA
jgi:probable O-glycosylation ligase (exosortase A-associated)